MLPEAEQVNVCVRAHAMKSDSTCTTRCHNSEWSDCSRPLLPYLIAIAALNRVLALALAFALEVHHLALALALVLA